MQLLDSGYQRCFFHLFLFLFVCLLLSLLCFLTSWVLLKGRRINFTFFSSLFLSHPSLLYLLLCQSSFFLKKHPSPVCLSVIFFPFLFSCCVCVRVCRLSFSFAVRFKRVYFISYIHYHVPTYSISHSIPLFHIYSFSYFYIHDSLFIYIPCHTPN